MRDEFRFIFVVAKNVYAFFSTTQRVYNAHVVDRTYAAYGVNHFHANQSKNSIVLNDTNTMKQSHISRHHKKKTSLNIVKWKRSIGVNES